MKRWGRLATAMVVFAGSSFPQRPTTEDTDAAIAQARKIALAYGASLPDFVCTQVVHRYGDRTQRGNWRPLDTLTVKLSYSERKEDHKLVMINGKPTDSAFADVGGASTVGEFGATLVHIFQPSANARFQWERWTRVRGRPAGEYSYLVELVHSNYSLTVRNGGEIRKVRVGFHGQVWVDRQTGDVLRYTYLADKIPADFPIRYAASTIDYANAEVGGKAYLLPAMAETEMRSPGLWNRNKAEFGDYRKFSADSSVSFTTDKNP